MKHRHIIVLTAITLLVFGTAFSVRADKVRSVEERFYTSHEGHSHLGSDYFLCSHVFDNHTPDKVIFSENRQGSGF